MDRLLQIINESADIQAKLRKHLQAEVTQQLTNAILAADRDRDFALSNENGEMDQLIFRLEHMPSVTFNKENFMKVVNTPPTPGELTMTECINIALSLDKDLTDPAAAIFTFRKPGKDGTAERFI